MQFDNINKYIEVNKFDKKILFNELEEIGEGKIKYYLYIRNMNKNTKKIYNSWILCCGFDSSDLLEKEWDDIVDCFAIHCQTKLESEIERSNLYIVFFIEETISKKLKMKIEYDRYSSRKIIINKKYPDSDEERNRIIDNMIFSISEYKEERTMNMLSELIKNDEPILNELYENFISGSVTIDDIFKEYKEQLGGDYDK